MRYRLITRAGLLVHPAGKSTLDVGSQLTLRERFERIRLAPENGLTYCHIKVNSQAHT
jgi:hypothetical protein